MLKSSLQSMSTPSRGWIALVLMLTLVLSACGGASEPAAEAPATSVPATAAPAVEATLAPTSVPQVEAPVADPEYLPPGKVLKSFRSRSETTFSTTFADGVVEAERGLFTGAFVRTDGTYGYDEVFEFYELGVGDEVDLATITPDMVIYSVGEGTAVATGDQWSVAERDPLSQPSPAFEVFTGLPGDFAAAIDQAESLGKETVNGVATTHYQVSERSAFESILGMVMSEEEGEVQQLTYDVWIADEGKFVVKYDFVIQVTDAQTVDLDGNPTIAQEILAHWVYELYDINAELSIEWPADAPKLGEFTLPGFGPDEFPIAPGATIESTMFGITTLVTAEDAESVTAFYEEALTELGWQMEGEGGFFNWSKGDLTLSMIIGPDEQGGTRITLIPG